MTVQNDAVVALGESGQLAVDFTEIFAWDLDFSRSVRAGDGFRVLYERLYLVDPDGSRQYLRPGRILAAHFEGAAGLHTAVYFEREPGKGGYFAPDGRSVQRSFLQAPLRYSRISSSFSTARRHPILKVTRPHHGIDYAAPLGTPVWAVAEGEVIHRGRAGGFGNLVKVRHKTGYVSYYSHLSRFAKGLRKGQRVGQKQVMAIEVKYGSLKLKTLGGEVPGDWKVESCQVQRGAGGPVEAPMSRDGGQFTVTLPEVMVLDAGQTLTVTVSLTAATSPRQGE